MAEDGPTETTALVERNTNAPAESTRVSNEPTISRRLTIDNNNGEHSLNMVLVVEDFRIAFYLVFIFIMIVGVILTKAFVNFDHGNILVSVYGISNTCAYFDWAPSTYVLPILWCFAVICGVVYCVTAIFRVRVACLEKKLTKSEEVLLILAYVYVALSFVYFSAIFAVRPERENPVTMVVHSIPYLNFKISFCVLQVAVVYFGLKVAWVDLKFPRWFRLASIIHVPILIVVTLAAAIWILNALGDMGEKNLDGKGLMWSVRGEASKMFGQVVVNILGMILGIILPLLQAIYICRHGTNTHAIVFAVSDNRVTAYET